MDEELAILCGFMGSAVGVFALGVATIQGLVFSSRMSRLERALKDATAGGLLAPQARTASAPVGTEAPTAMLAEAEPPAEDPAAPDDSEPTAPDVTPEPEGTADSLPETVVTPAPVQAPAKPSRPAITPERILVWGAVLMGGFMVIVGVLFGLVAVMRSGWLGPGARISLALIGGTVVWGLGALLRMPFASRLRAVPAALEAIGVSTLMGALFAGHSMYGLLGAGPTFGLFLAVSLVAGIRAAVLDDRAMAYLGLTGGLLAPVVVSTGNNGAVGLFLYLTLLVTGTLLVSVRRKWGDLILYATAGCAVLFLGWTSSWYVAGSVWMAHLGVVLLTVPFSIAAARAQDDVTRWCAVIGAATWPLLLTPWLVPVAAFFTDPRNGLQVFQAGSLRALFPLVAPAVVSLPLAFAARHRRDPWMGAVACATTAWTVWIAVSAWGAMKVPAIMGDTWMRGIEYLGPLEVVSAGLLLPLFTLGLAFVGRQRTGRALALPVLPAVVSGTVLAMATGGARFGLTLGALTLLACLLSVVSTEGAILWALVLVQTVVLTGAASEFAHVPAVWVLVPALTLLGAVPLAALGPRRGTWAQVAGLLAIPAVGPALYLVLSRGPLADMMGLLPIFLGGVALLCTGVLLRRHGLPQSSPKVGLAVALTLTGVTFALPLQLSSAWLTVGWSLEALALAAISRKIPQPLLRAGGVVLGATVGIRLLLNPWTLSYGTADGWPILNWTLYTWGVPTLCLLGVAWLLEDSKAEEAGAVLLRILAMFTGFALINVEISHAFQHAGPLELSGTTLLQAMVRSLSWGGYGLGLLMVGLFVRSRYTRFFGFAFIVLAATKVLIIDLWTLPGFVRVGSLVGLGVILLVAALLFERLVLRADQEDP